MRNDLGHDSFLEITSGECYLFWLGDWEARLTFYESENEWAGPEYFYCGVELVRGKGIKPPKALIERAVRALYIVRGVIKHA